VFHFLSFFEILPEYFRLEGEQPSKNSVLAKCPVSYIQSHDIIVVVASVGEEYHLSRQRNEPREAPRRWWWCRWPCMCSEVIEASMYFALYNSISLFVDGAVRFFRFYQPQQSQTSIINPNSSYLYLLSY
jgi:hypothetical protein